jgi:hypothetical protein
VRLWLSVDWNKVPAITGNFNTLLAIQGADERHETFTIKALTPSLYANAGTGMFLEGDGYVSVEAENYTRKVETAVKWQRIPGLGRTAGGVEVKPVTIRAATPGGSSPRLEYAMYLTDTGRFIVCAYFSPTLNFNGKDLRYGVSFDDGAIQILPLGVNSTQKIWANSVANNIFTGSSVHQLSRPGKHVLKYWMVDPGVLLQKMVVDAGGMKPSYLGPPESRFKAR